MDVFAYLRISTQKESEDELSIEAQEELINVYAVKHNLHINYWLRDRSTSDSVSFGEREYGAKLVQHTKRGDVIITARLDRMFCDASDALETLKIFNERGVILHIIDLGGHLDERLTKTFFTILSAVTKKTRGKSREGISKAKEKMREEDRYQGGKVPFGYTVDSDGFLEEDELEQECLKFMEQQRKEGLSYRKISEVLEQRFNVSISHSGIRKILVGIRKTD